MTLLGLDFDNTLVRYDKLFHQLALEKGLIEESLPADKTTIRDYLRSQGKDEQFTLLQGEVYGPRILDAEPAKGMLQALKQLCILNYPMVIVSHKTKTPYKGPEWNLHKSAMGWLEKHGFFSKSGLDWKPKQVFFESSKQLKAERIEHLGCTHYIDDLPEILESLSDSTKKILYDPNKTQRLEAKRPIYKMHNWLELISIFAK